MDLFRDIEEVGHDLAQQSTTRYERLAADEDIRRARRDEQSGTAEYYRLINEAVNGRLGGWNTAELIVSSVNFGNIERFVRTDACEKAGEYLAQKAQGLERAGADLLLCVSNTMHRVADIFTAGLNIPFLHIVDPTGEAIQAAGLTRVAILGTRPVMSTASLKSRYAERFGVEVIAPEEAEQAQVDRIIFNELVRRELRLESKNTYLDIIDRLVNEVPRV